MAEDTNDTIKDIIMPLIRSETDVIASMRVLVEKSKDFIAIEEGTNRILLLNKHFLTNRDRIALILIGKYFANYAGLIKTKYMTSAELSSELNIPATTLSAPLGTLVSEGIIKRTTRGEYEIVSYNIENYLDRLRTSRGLV